ncbi:MAG TPA: 50S ribosomal protein L25/general stress protein Ctc [Natronosporangium sp.]
MSATAIRAEIRSEFGKGAARRVRRAGMVPAVLYGHGEAPKHLALPVKEFAAAIRHGGMTQVLTLEISDGSQATALPKDIQRDPVKNTYEHADLLLVRRGEKVTVEVPIQLVGEAAPGTLVIFEHDHLAINADATQLPDHLEVSIEGLTPGSRVTAADVTLPAGAELAADPSIVIALINVAPTAEQLDAEAAEGEAAEPAEAGEAAGEASSES